MSVRLHRSHGVKGVESRYLASGTTRDEGQTWAGVDWELFWEGEELSSEHLHYICITSAPLGVSAGGILPSAWSGSSTDDRPKGGMGESHEIPLGPPISACPAWDFCSALQFASLFLPLPCPPHSFAVSFLLLAGAVSRGLRKGSVLLAKSSLAKSSHSKRR